MKTYRRLLTAILGACVVVMLLAYLNSNRPGQLHVARDSHVAVLLRDGKVLIAGGDAQSKPSTVYAELLETFPWLVDKLKLSDGSKQTPVLDCEIFDPKALSWSRSSPINNARALPSAFLLPDGRVFFGGGFTASDNDSNGKVEPSTPSEIYDPVTEKWTPCPSTADVGKSVIARLSKTQILKLQSGNVDESTEALIYDLTAQTWSRHPEYDCTDGFDDNPVGYVLPTGQVIVESISTELYDAKLHQWTRIEQIDLPFYSVVVLKNGEMLRAGGLDEERIRDDAGMLDLKTKAAWVDLPLMKKPRVGATLTELPNGKVLAAGGGTAACEIFDARTNTWSLTGTMHEARKFHTATLLQDGRVLVVGGVAGEGFTGVGGGFGESLNTCEIYDPATGQWTAL